MEKVIALLESTLEPFEIYAPKKNKNVIWKRVLVALTVPVYTVCLSLCLVPAQTFDQYAMTIFTIITGMSVAAMCVLFNCYAPEFFAFLNDLKRGIEIRKF